MHYELSDIQSCKETCESVQDSEQIQTQKTHQVTYGGICRVFNPLNDNPDSDTGDNPDSNTEEVDYDLLPPPPKFTCFKQAIEALEDVQVSLEHRDYVEQTTSVGKVMINLAGISVYNYTQTTIDQYYS